MIFGVRPVLTRKTCELQPHEKRPIKRAGDSGRALSARRVDVHEQAAPELLRRVKVNRSGRASQTAVQRI